MITLESTKIAFDAWRAERCNTSIPFPATLWDMARQLLKTHGKAEVCKTLRISSSQIKKHCEENLALSQAPNNGTARMLNSQSRQIPACDDFVVATSAPHSFDSPVKESMSMLILTGSNKTLQLSIPTSALSNVLPTLGALL